MALDPSSHRNGGAPPFQYQVESYELDENTKTPGMTATESNQSSYLGSFPSLAAPLSSDQQYIRTVSNVEFAKALLAERPTPWTKPMFKLYYFLFVAFMSSAINGYDSSVMGGINAMKQYQKYFNMQTLGSTTGIVFVIYSVGHFSGSFISGPMSDSWGRRWGLFTGAAITVLGTCVQSTSTGHPQFIFGRFLLGLGASILTTAGPTYVAEMAHPAWRGTLTGLYNSWYFVGGMLATWTMYGSEKITSELAWRIPLWLQLLCAGLLMVTCLWCPETPRWLVSNDRCEEAIRVMTMYHGEGNRKSPIVLLSYKEMLEEIVISGSDKRWWDYSELYSTNAARWRMLCVVAMAFFSQWSGNGVVTYFMPVLLANIGILDEGTQLLLNAILMVLSFCVAVAGAFLVDRVGRRPMLLLGTSLFIVWWTVLSILSSFYGHSDNTNHYGTRSVVAFIYLFSITHSFAYTPLQLLYPVECLSYETRAKGMGVYNFFVNVAAVFNTYGMSNIIEKIDWNFCFIYIVWDVIELVLIYFLFVETKNRTLEEINEIFKSANPKQRSLRKHVILVTGEGVLYQGIAGLSAEGDETHEIHIVPPSSPPSSLPS